MRASILFFTLFSAAANANPTSPNWEERCDAAKKGEAVLVDTFEGSSHDVTSRSFQVEGIGEFLVCGKAVEGEYAIGMMTLPNGKVIKFDRTQVTSFVFADLKWEIDLNGAPVPKGKIESKKPAQVANAQKMEGLPDLSLDGF